MSWPAICWLLTYKVVRKITHHYVPFCCTELSPPWCCSITGKHVPTVLEPPVSSVLHTSPVGICPGSGVRPLPGPVCIFVMRSNPEVFARTEAELMNKAIFLRRMDGNKMTPITLTPCFSFTSSSLVFKVFVTVGPMLQPGAGAVPAHSSGDAKTNVAKQKNLAQ